MTAPSTAWREIVGPDEDAQFQRYAEQLVEVQRKQEGKGRGLHRKQHLGLRATVEVVDGLPAHAKQGLFARPGKHEALIRLSNGGPKRDKDARPDVRGFAVRIRADGDGALGGKTEAQCFLMINTPAFAFRTVEQFMGVALAASRGQFAILRQLQRYHGFFGGLKRAAKLGKEIGKPFAGFARETFHTAAPVAWGAYAAKVRIVPIGAAETPAPNKHAWAEDVRARLAQGPLRWELQAQFFVDETTTPIEDPTIVWPGDPVTVARVEVPTQDPDATAEEVERALFDPWQALVEHRPLGEVMRARKVAYFASQRERAG